MDSVSKGSDGEYQLAWDVLNQESSRAWTRFSILVGGQMVILAAFVGNAEDLQGDVQGLLSGGMVVISFLSSVVVAFGLHTTRAALTMVWRLEQASNGRLRLVHLASRRTRRLYFPLNHVCAMLMALALLAIWASLWLLLP